MSTPTVWKKLRESLYVYASFTSTIERTLSLSYSYEGNLKMNWMVSSKRTKAFWRRDVYVCEAVGCVRISRCVWCGSCQSRGNLANSQTETNTKTSCPRHARLTEPAPWSSSLFQAERHLSVHSSFFSCPGSTSWRLCL